MGQLGCKCGEVISDTGDHLDYKYYVLPDARLDEISVYLTGLIDSFVQAIDRGKRDEWINQNFAPGYPKGVESSGMIHDLLSSKLNGLYQEMFKCENCGRILLENVSNQKFDSYTSEDLGLK